MRILIALLLSCVALFGVNQVHEGDYYVSGTNIVVPDVVKGSVYALGSQIFIKGRVEGDVIATGGLIEIDGEIWGNARLAGGQVMLNGLVGKSVTMMGGSLQLGRRGLIEGNASLVGGDVYLNGKVLGNVTINASTAEVNGTIGGSFKGREGELRLGSESVINGNLEYTSSAQAVVDTGATVKGQTIYHPSKAIKLWSAEWKEKVIYGSKVLGILMNFLFSFVFGIIYIKMFPKGFNKALKALKKKPWKSLGVGLLVLILLPLISILLLVSVLGFPLALALIAFGLITFYTAKVIPIIWITHAIFPKKMGDYWDLFIGLILFFILLQIPFFGAILSVTFILLGTGSALVGIRAQKSA